MFSLQNKTAKIGSVNPRAEMHGDQNVLAVDIKVGFDSSNKILDVFSPALRPFFFKQDTESTQAGLFTAEEKENGDDLTALRHPQVGGFSWNEDMEGCKLVLAYGIGGPSDIVLSDVKVGKIHLQPQDGGTVSVSFRAQAYPDQDVIGKLCSLIQGEAKVTLVPPENVELFEEQQEKQVLRDRAEAQFYQPGEQPDTQPADDDDVVDATFTPKETVTEPASISVD